MRLVRPVVAFALLTFAAPSARAEESAKAAAPKPIPPLATTVDAKAAIAAFKAEFKGKDVAKKADAVDALGAVNHPFVVDELVKVTRHKDPELRAAAYQNLERQRGGVGQPAGARRQPQPVLRGDRQEGRRADARQDVHQ